MQCRTKKIAKQWNPATRRWESLPLTPEESVWKLFLVVSTSLRAVVHAGSMQLHNDNS